MNKRVIVYTRVSTDEQNNGYSPADQRDRLYRFCENNYMEILGHYHDDASGKSFDRPEWKKVMAYLKQNKRKVDYIYFQKWDRFSRNVGLAYAELAKLEAFGVEARALDQPLDLSVPEQKMMLAIYLAAPEIDNDRRSMNILAGIRKAKRLGRWLGSCPRGYRNARDERNKPIIVPEGGDKEKLVKLAFKEFATGQYHIEDLRRKLWKRGLKCARNTFWELLRNKAYIGKVYLKAIKGEPEEWLDGLHTPLVDEKTFYKVQEILNGRKKKNKPTNLLVRDEFPLRGLLECSRCHGTLTASFSRGKMGGLYAYYHCKLGCKERRKAEEVNQAMVNLLTLIQPKPGAMNLFQKIVQQKLQDRKKNHQAEGAKKQKELEKQKQRLANARTLMLDGEIDAADYKSMKEEIEKKIIEVQSELQDIHGDTKEYEAKLRACTSVLSNISNFYSSHDTVTKRRVVSSIFPEKLIFDVKKSRTLHVNPVVALLCSLDKGSDVSKKKKHTEFGVLSCKVELAGIEPASG